MDTFSHIVNGLLIALTPINLMYTFIGAVVGTAIGVLPGLGPPATVALLLPITYKINAASGVMMLAGIYYGAMYGGSTTSILLNIPGEAASVVTCMDGYQMARQGRAGPALGASALGSFFAGTVGLVGLVLVAPPMANFAIKFGYAETASLVVLGLMMATYLSEGSVLKGLLMSALGLLLGTVGLDPVFGVERFTFGVSPLTDGVEFIVAAMGLFGITEVLCNLERPEVRDVFKTSIKNLFPTREDWRQSWGSMIRGTLIGFFIGVLPGGGGVISAFIAYALEKRVSKHPERFGKGAMEGVIGPESANNAASSSSFIPLLTLGIPGNATTAMIFVALMIHGIRPGPLLLQEHPSLFWGVIGSMYIGNVMLLALNLPLIGIWVRLLKVPYQYLAVTVAIICTIGAYSVKNSVFDVGAMVVFGIIGYFMRKGGFPGAPLLLAMLLGRMLERTVQQALAMSGGDPVVFIERPISAALLLVAAFVLISPAIRWLWRRTRSVRPI